MSKQIGHQKESLAIDYLKRIGYHIIERNYSTKQGEVDIIAIDVDTLAFIEVKYRASDDYGRAYEYVRPYKVRRIMKAAWHYIQNAERPLPDSYRVDVVAIDGDEITLYKNIGTS